MGERVALVDVSRVTSNIINNKDDVSWGPNATFRFPLHGGTGHYPFLPPYIIVITPSIYAFLLKVAFGRPWGKLYLQKR